VRRLQLSWGALGTLAEKSRERLAPIIRSGPLDLVEELHRVRADLELPVPERREVEIVTPGSAATLLAALPSADRAVWATALYAELRSGELRALRWGAVDVSRGIIEVRESWDPKEGATEPKTRRSRRRVPMPSVLRGLLLDLRQPFCARLNRPRAPRLGRPA
jgi:integrase